MFALGAWGPCIFALRATRFGRLQDDLEAASVRFKATLLRELHSGSPVKEKLRHVADVLEIHDKMLPECFSLFCISLCLRPTGARSF